jgi:SAM-dependent methyltransferase
MAYREFVSLVHKSTKRDYLARVTERDKADVAELALKWDYDYWDGSRQTGYGGYKYDGRWRKVADAMVAAYGIKPGMRILDVGAGKGFLLHDFAEAVPGVEVVGLDVSKYGIEHAMPNVKNKIVHGSAETLPFPDQHFDLIVSINTLHNLYIKDLFSALTEIESRPRRQVSLCGILSQRAREGEPALLAADLPRISHARGMGFRVQADRLQG